MKIHDYCISLIGHTFIQNASCYLIECFFTLKSVLFAGIVAISTFSEYAWYFLFSNFLWHSIFYDSYKQIDFLGLLSLTNTFTFIIFIDVFGLDLPSYYIFSLHAFWFFSFHAVCWIYQLTRFLPVSLLVFLTHLYLLLVISVCTSYFYSSGDYL